MKPKLFVVRKYIMAKSARDALRKEKTAPVDDLWVDDEWKKGNSPSLAEAIGFHSIETE